MCNQPGPGAAGNCSPGFVLYISRDVIGHNVISCTVAALVRNIYAETKRLIRLTAALIFRNRSRYIYLS